MAKINQDKEVKIENVVTFRNDSKGKKVSDIFIMDVISKWWGENLPKIKDVVAQEKPTKINLHIVNCPGGDVGEALAIKGFIRDYNAPVTTIITGFVASAATIVAMAGDEVIMKEDALWLVHNASTGIWGNKEELKKVIDDLETVDNLIASIYCKKTGMDKADVVNLMNENKWISADEAVELGFVDKKVEKVNIAATVAPATKEDFQNWNLSYPTNYSIQNNSQNLIQDMKKEIKDALAGLVNEIKELVKPKNTEEVTEETTSETTEEITEETTTEETETTTTEETTDVEEQIQTIEDEIKNGNLSDEDAKVIKNKLTSVLNDMKKMKGAKSGGKSNSGAPIQTENQKPVREQMNDESLMTQIKNRTR